MPEHTPVVITAAVEGIVDDAVARRLITFAGGIIGTIYGKNGKASLRKQVAGYNNAARQRPWLTLVDLDHDFDCAPLLQEDWLPHTANLMCLRIAVHEVEAWLLADRKGIAKFLSVSQVLVPHDPEALENPKKTLVDLAKRSGRRAIREGMAPREGSSREVGPTYSSRLIEFAQRVWSPEEAMNTSDSLRRCVNCLRKLVERSGV